MRLVLHATLVAQYPGLVARLTDGTDETLVEVDAEAAAPLPKLTAHWTRSSSSSSNSSSNSSSTAAACRSAVSERLPRVVLVWEPTQLMRLATEGHLLPRIANAQAACTTWLAGSTLSLVVLGKGGPGLERCVAALQLEAGLTVRRAVNDKELADLRESARREPALCSLSLSLSPTHLFPLLSPLIHLSLPSTAPVSRVASVSAHGAALASGEKRSAKHAASGVDAAPDFLAGLTSSDVLYNKSVPKSLDAAWLGALKQLLPDSAAVAVHAAYPSFRQLYSHLRQSEASGGKAEGSLAELRLAGGKRLGPARSQRLARVLMATRAGELVG